jgi:CheY-like chemotaxis protein
MPPAQRILVVDDSDDIRELYQLILEAEGYEVDVAADGARGFERARAWRPDLVVLDVVMPVMDGLELLLKLRSDLVPPIPPVVLCSGFDLTEEEALRRGATSFLRKPLESDDLIEAIRHALDGRTVAPETIRRQRDRSTVMRRRALDEARELVRRLDARGITSQATLNEPGESKIDTVAAYIGVPRGAVALARDEGLIVLSATELSGLPPGFDLGRAVPEAYEVLESGSALLLPDASAVPFASVSRALGGIRFFAGVPLRVTGQIVIGVACLFDALTHQVDGADLAALELLGRRGSDVLWRFAEQGDARIVRQGRGVVARGLFDELLDVELHILESRGGSLEVAAIELRDLGALRGTLARAPSQERLLAGVLSSTRVALFKRAVDDSARRQLAAIIDDLHERRQLVGFGLVDLPCGGVHGFGARELVHVASAALDRSLERGDGPHRIVIEEERAP